MKKNIAFIINSLESAGGTERVVSNVSNEIIKDPNFKVTIIALKGASAFFPLHESINIIYLEKIVKQSWLGRFGCLVRLVNQSNFDSIIGISITKLNIWLGFVSIFFKKNVKLIASEHINFSKTSFFLKCVKKLIYGRFDYIAVLTLFDKEIMDNLRYRNVIQIPNASSFSPKDSDLNHVLARPRRIISVGRLEEQKGFDLLIESWKKIQSSHTDWELVIVGEGSLKSKLEDAINHAKKQLGLFNCVILPFTKDIGALLNTAQVYALSSRFEGYPMVLVEALTYGCPIISFDCETGPREIFADKNEGFLVPPNNIEIFARSIHLMLKDDNLRNQTFHNIMEGRKRFFIENVIEKWKNIL
ncbi:glycosyltransferase family 4 protein [Sphingobacterium sp. DR205]|uniref:glycosyltransferase family 4 protein n=1 Tax=Sphingobacterium sp. DR205 TaxID=2713573 RepID=UPI0013E4892C|nr:glycosyltransferase family 4 protein [Sphingobacterium sp. DR205]QIH31570.1 glycosyltransferase family 4 protein [Sphingobacterium sp. DR205]